MADTSTKDSGSIEELAGLFLAKKCSMRSMTHLFGRHESYEAIGKVVQATLLLDPEHPRANLWSDMSMADIDFDKNDMFE